MSFRQSFADEESKATRNLFIKLRFLVARAPLCQNDRSSNYLLKALIPG